MRVEGKYTSIGFQGDSLPGIYNYREISERVCTSGQPTKNQFTLIKDAGYRTVINLAPHDAENALEDESGALASLGLRYIHIPVDFANPTQADFDRFVMELQRFL